MEWIDIPDVYLVKEGIQLVKLNEISFCLLFYNGKYVAFSKSCPHAGAPLVQGWCADGEIVCPYHRHRFDIGTGRGPAGQGNCIRIYPTKYEDGKWYIGVQVSFFKKIFKRR